MTSGLPKLVWLLAAGVGGNLLAAATSREAPLLLTQVPHRTASPSPTSERADQPATGDWFDGARVVLVQPDNTIRVLSEGFHSAADPDLSFDGQRALFAGRKDAATPWRVYEVALDGTGLRAITPEHLDARHPIHVSTLFTLDSPQPWFTTVFVGAERGPTGAVSLASPQQGTPWNLYNVTLDGAELRRLTWTPHSSLDPFQMWDGRVIYSSERRGFEPGAADSRFGLFAVHLEGADPELYGAASGQRIQRQPCATDGGLVVFIEAEAHSVDGGGQLACVTQRRPHLEYRRLTQDPDRLYADPHPWRSNIVLLASRSIRRGESWGIWSYNAETTRGEPLYDDPQFHDLQARFVRPRPRPDGHSTVVNLTAATGTFYGLNCYTADERLAPHVRTGEVKRVRFIEAVLPNPADERLASPLGREARRRLVGEAPVEPDGSFNVEVPASTPLLLQTLDGRGLALATCGWIWVQPKETRGCIGCHEDPELIPENEYVLALRRPSNRLVLAPEQRRTLTFRDHIAPLLEQQCALADCHGGHDTPLHLDLKAGRSGSAELERAYHTLLAATPGDSATAPRVTPGRARTSSLVWHLFGANTARPWDPSAGSRAEGSSAVKLMPPVESGRTLRPEQIHTIVQWIDLGAAFDDAGGPVGGTPLQQAQAR